MERIIRVKTAAAAHIGWLAYQLNQTLDHFPLSAIKEERVAAILVLFNGIQFKFNGTKLDFTVDFNGFFRGLYFAPVKLDLGLNLFFGEGTFINVLPGINGKGNAGFGHNKRVHCTNVFQPILI